LTIAVVVVRLCTLVALQLGASTGCLK